ncbi:MAG: type II toxin-antitoxin system VapC family toxin [Aquabacterium sp.]|nr:type II toxin-antitoxin system VapC family toxin [Aquabacterium sp.]
MRVFFDTSAFAKRYVEEAGSAQVLHWCDQATTLVLSVIAVPELVSALCRLRREGRLSVAQYAQLRDELLADIADALICDTSPAVVGHAVRALEAHPLRGMDAIHIGAALQSGAQAFVTADGRQAQAARGMGLQVVQI